MKVLVGIVISLFLGNSSMASESCLGTLTERYKSEEKQSADWGFVGISSLSNAEARMMIKKSLPDDGLIKKAQMQNLLNDKNVEFYSLQWMAPSNSGTTIIAADTRGCSVIADLLFWSEE